MQVIAVRALMRLLSTHPSDSTVTGMIVTRFCHNLENSMFKASLCAVCAVHRPNFHDPLLSNSRYLLST